MRVNIISSLLVALAAIVLLDRPLQGQVAVCSITSTLTTAGTGSAFDNRPTSGSLVRPCQQIGVNYIVTGFTAMFVQFEGAPDVSGSPGTFAPLTFASGPNPLLVPRNTSGSVNLAALGNTSHQDWLRFNLVSKTGSGSVAASAVGPNPPLPPSTVIPINTSFVPLTGNSCNFSQAWLLVGGMGDGTLYTCVNGSLEPVGGAGGGAPAGCPGAGSVQLYGNSSTFGCDAGFGVTPNFSDTSSLFSIGGFNGDTSTVEIDLATHDSMDTNGSIHASSTTISLIANPGQILMDTTGITTSIVDDNIQIGDGVTTTTELFRTTTGTISMDLSAGNIGMSDTNMLFQTPNVTIDVEDDSTGELELFATKMLLHTLGFLNLQAAGGSVNITSDTSISLNGAVASCSGQPSNTLQADSVTGVLSICP